MRPLLLLTLVLVACHLDEPPATPDDIEEDAGVSRGPCRLACAHLRDLGCPEGHGAVGGSSCEVVCVRANALRPLPLACWSAAKTSTEAKGCGALRCVR